MNRNGSWTGAVAAVLPGFAAALALQLVLLPAMGLQSALVRALGLDLAARVRLFTFRSKTRRLPLSPYHGARR